MVCVAFLATFAFGIAIAGIGLSLRIRRICLRDGNDMSNGFIFVLVEQSSSPAFTYLVLRSTGMLTLAGTSSLMVTVTLTVSCTTFASAESGVDLTSQYGTSDGV